MLKKRKKLNIQGFNLPVFICSGTEDFGTCTPYITVLNMCRNSRPCNFDSQVSRRGIGTEVLGEEFSSPPKQISFPEALALACNREVSVSDLVWVRPDLFSKDMPEFTRIYKALTKIVAPQFDSPVFIVDMPDGLNPFCKITNDKALQAVLVAKGMHIGTISVDENNVEIVSQRLQKQKEESGIPINTGYLELLNFGMPPISGIGLGMTRLAMLLLPREKQNVRDVIPFPFI